VNANAEPAIGPADDDRSLLMTQGLASYYADDFNGKKTANGEIYDMFQLTAAHRSLPFGTTLRVTNLDNMKSVVVRINDRGPFKMERIIDLSLGAATQLQMMGVGTARVQLDVIEWGDNLYKK
jgi:rare lipoprotein A